MASKLFFCDAEMRLANEEKLVIHPDRDHFTVHYFRKTGDDNDFDAGIITFRNGQVIIEEQ